MSTFVISSKPRRLPYVCFGLRAGKRPWRRDSLNCSAVRLHGWHGGRDQRTHDDFKSRSLKIAADLGRKLISTVTPKDLTDWLAGLGKGDTSRKPLTPRYVLNYRNTLAETFR